MNPPTMEEIGKRLKERWGGYLSKAMISHLISFIEESLTLAHAEGKREGIEESSKVFDYSINTQTILVKEVGNPSTKFSLETLVHYRDKILALLPPPAGQGGNK